MIMMLMMIEGDGGGADDADGLLGLPTAALLTADKNNVTDKISS